MKQYERNSNYNDLGNTFIYSKALPSSFNQLSLQKAMYFQSNHNDQFEKSHSFLKLTKR